MMSRDPKAAVRQYGRLSQRQLGFLYWSGTEVKSNHKFMIERGE